VREWATHLTARLRAEAAACGAAEGQAAIRVLGPAPAPIPRLRERFRWHLQVLGPDGAILRGLVRRATAGLKTPPDLAWIVDVDPVDML
jgi:primosomal protein N' (replication factor Y)